MLAVSKNAINLSRALQPSGVLCEVGIRRPSFLALAGQAYSVGSIACVICSVIQSHWWSISPYLLTIKIKIAPFGGRYCAERFRLRPSSSFVMTQLTADVMAGDWKFIKTLLFLRCCLRRIPNWSHRRDLGMPALAFAKANDMHCRQFDWDR